MVITFIVNYIYSREPRTGTFEESMQSSSIAGGFSTELHP